jgi:hypothetical protein
MICAAAAAATRANVYHDRLFQGASPVAASTDDAVAVFGMRFGTISAMRASLPLCLFAGSAVQAAALDQAHGSTALRCLMCMACMQDYVA